MADLPEKQTVNVLKIRDSTNTFWLNNFCMGSWRVRNADNSDWIEMSPDNTKVRNAANSAWLELGCPNLGDPFWHYLLDPPDVVTLAPTTTKAPTTTPYPTTYNPTTTSAPTTTVAGTTTTTTTSANYPILLGEIHIYADEVNASMLATYEQEANSIAAICRTAGMACMPDYNLWYLYNPADMPSDWWVSWVFTLGDNINWVIEGDSYNTRLDVTGSGTNSITIQHEQSTPWGEHFVSVGSAWVKSEVKRGASLLLKIYQNDPC